MYNLIEIYDIEVYPNLFIYQGFDKDNIENKTEFVFHENYNDFNTNFKSYNFYEFLTKILKGGIGFNNLSYDSQILQFIINNYSDLKKLKINESLLKIYNYSQKIINSNSPFPDYPEWKLTIPQLDLFKIWHFDNKNRFTSLKWIEYTLDFENIQELPIPFYKNINKEEIKLLQEYCWNDINATYELYKITKGNTELPLYKNVDKIKLREDINNEFHIKSDNYSDIKIGDEILKRKYCEIKNIDKKNINKPIKKNKPIYFKDCIPEYINFENIKLQNFYKGIKNIKLDV